MISLGTFPQSNGNFHRSGSPFFQRTGGYFKFMDIDAAGKLKGRKNVHFGIADSECTAVPYLTAHFSITGCFVQYKETFCPDGDHFLAFSVHNQSFAGTLIGKGGIAGKFRGFYIGK